MMGQLQTKVAPINEVTTSCSVRNYRCVPGMNTTDRTHGGSLVVWKRLVDSRADHKREREPLTTPVEGEVLSSTL